MQSNTSIRPTNFCIIGAGFISDRHLAAMESVGGTLKAVVDIDPSKETKLDSGVKFFTTYNEFSKHKVFKEVDTIVICTPNFTHYKIMNTSLQLGKNVLCEKPGVISTKELKSLKTVAEQSPGQLFFVHQLRTSQKLIELKETLKTAVGRRTVEVSLNMHRGDFYWEGWKGKKNESGGILFNIGVHYLDLLVWLFGEPLNKEVVSMTDKSARLILEFEKALCGFELDLTVEKDKQSRLIKIDGDKLNLTRILESLHTKVYEEFVEGKGTTIDDIAPTIQLCEELTNSQEG